MTSDKTIGEPYVLNTPTIAVPFSRHGMSGSIGFYGYCAEHQGNRP